MTVFECEKCNSKIKVDTPCLGYLVVNICKNCNISMPIVYGQKAIKITIDGIVSDPSKPTWEYFLRYWNYSNLNDCLVELTEFESIEDKDNYINYLREIGLKL